MNELLAQAAQNQGITFLRLAGRDQSTHLQMAGKGGKVILHGRILPGTDHALATLASMRHSANTLLSEAGIAAPKSLSLDVWPTDDTVLAPDTINSIEELLAGGGRWVLKPGQRRSGLPLNLNVSEPSDVISHLEDHAKDASEWVLEAFVDGRGLTALVVKGQVVAARQQAPFTLTGDGMQTLEELIDTYNAQAGETAHFMMNAEARQLLRDQGAFLGEVVPDGKSIRLSNKPLDIRQSAAVSNDDLAAIQLLSAQVQKIFSGPVLGLDLIMNSTGLYVIGLDLAPVWIEFVEDNEAADVAAKLMRAALE